MGAATAAVNALSASPQKGSFEEALKEHQDLMQVVGPCLEIDPNAFGSPDFLRLRQGGRVIDQALAAVREIVKLAPKEDFASALEEHKTILAIMNPCTPNKFFLVI